MSWGNFCVVSRLFRILAQLLTFFFFSRILIFILLLLSFGFGGLLGLLTTFLAFLVLSRKFKVRTNCFWASASRAFLTFFTSFLSLPPFFFFLPLPDPPDTEELSDELVSKHSKSLSTDSSCSSSSASSTRIRYWFKSWKGNGVEFIAAHVCTCMIILARMNGPCCQAGSGSPEPPFFGAHHLRSFGWSPVAPSLPQTAQKSQTSWATFWRPGACMCVFLVCEAGTCCWSNCPRHRRPRRRRAPNLKICLGGLGYPGSRIWFFENEIIRPFFWEYDRIKGTSSCFSCHFANFDWSIGVSVTQEKSHVLMRSINEWKFLTSMKIM